MHQQFETLPCETELAAGGLVARSLEAAAGRGLLWAAIVSFPFALFIVDRLGAFLITLDPGRLAGGASGGVSILNVMVSVAGLLFVGLLWRSLDLTGLDLLDMRLRGFTAAICSASLLLLISVAYSSAKFEWILLESAKVRLDYSFARSIVSWRAAEREARSAVDHGRDAPSVWIVGSSQISYGVDANLLRNELREVAVRKKVLPGFGVMNYLLVVPEIETYRPSVVVCFLSEFDFYREDSLPASRLRYFSTGQGLRALAGVLEPKDLWNSRAELADLAIASVLPVWRDRDLIRAVVFNMWTRWRPTGNDSPDDVSLSAVAGIEQGRKNLRSSIKRSQLLDANFRAFEAFADRTSALGTEVLVFEGATNPRVIDVYESAYRSETRARLAAMETSGSIEFVDETEMPVIRADDFMDAYHLGPMGRSRFTRVVAAILRRRLPPGDSPTGTGE